MPHTLTRAHLLDWFDEWSPNDHDGAHLLAAYNALTGSQAVLVCAHCGKDGCRGRLDMAHCERLRRRTEPLNIQAREDL